MAQGNTLKAKLKDALKAVDQAPASMQNKLKDVRRELNLAIQSLGTTPGPAPKSNN
jgi:hypothetical protein